MAMSPPAQQAWLWQQNEWTKTGCNLQLPAAGSDRWAGENRRLLLPLTSTVPPFTSLLFNTTSGWTFLLVMLMCLMLCRTPAFAFRVAWLPWWKIRQHGGLVSAGKTRTWHNAAGIGGAETGWCLEGRMCLQIFLFAFSYSHTGKRRTSFGHTMMVWQEREKEAQNKGNQRYHLSWRCFQVHLKKLEYQLKGQYFLPFISEREQHLPEMMWNMWSFICWLQPTDNENPTQPSNFLDVPVHLNSLFLFLIIIFFFFLPGPFSGYSFQWSLRTTCRTGYSIRVLWLRLSLRVFWRSSSWYLPKHKKSNEVKRSRISQSTLALKSDRRKWKPSWLLCRGTGKVQLGVPRDANGLKPSLTGLLDGSPYGMRSA